MKIGVIADTHDNIPKIKKALAAFKKRECGIIIHAGDVVAPFAAKALKAAKLPIYAVYGNNDGERKGLKGVLPGIQDGPLFVEADGRTILVHHFLDWCSRGDIEKADIVITGHTHEVVNERKDEKLFLNPGECCGWLHGRCTVAMLDPGAMTAEIIEVPV